MKNPLAVGCALLWWCGVVALHPGGLLAAEAEGVEPNRASALTLGLFSQEKEVFVQGDLLIPVYFYDTGLLFINPRGALNDRDQEEFNFGLGLRHRVDARRPFILGANVFYDARWTRHNNRFDQLGLGLEYLSDWVDARANYYVPDRDTFHVESMQVESVSRQQRTEQSTQVIGWEDPYAAQHQIRQEYTVRTTMRNITTTRTLTQQFDRYEAALEGWDAEIGIRIPVLQAIVEPRLFGGYQYFDNPFGGSLKGWKGRLELRALDGLVTLDAHAYESRALNQTDYLVGARLRVPLDLGAIARGRNPFADPPEGGRKGLESRLTEMVMRDPKIQTTESGYIEDVEQRRQSVAERNSTTTQVQSQTAVLADGVTFVDGDRGNDDNPGTFEAPKLTIQSGVDNAFAGSSEALMAQELGWDGVPMRVVYVFDAATPYAGGVEISGTGIALIGSGTSLHGFGGRSFGGQSRPLIGGETGGDNGLLVPLGQVRGIYVPASADYTLIAGFEIAHVSMGIYSNSGKLGVLDNHIHDTTDALLMESISGDVQAWVAGNLIESNSAYGFEISTTNEGGAFTLFVSDNVFRHNFMPFRATAYNYDDIEMFVAGNDFSHSRRGAWINVDTRYESDGDVFVGLWNNTANDLSGGYEAIGFDVTARSHHGDVHVLFNGNSAADNESDAFASNLESRGAGHAQLTMVGNRVARSGGGFYSSVVASSGDAGFLFTGNTATDNGWTGSWSRVQSTAGDIDVVIADNVVTGTDNGLDLGGIHVIGSAAMGTARLNLHGNTIQASSGTGMILNATADSVDLQAAGNVLRGNQIGFSGGVTANTHDLNFGRAADGSMGYNTFDNVEKNFVNTAPATFSAENNWWGTTNPAAFKIDGNVDSDPFLDYDPNP